MKKKLMAVMTAATMIASVIGSSSVGAFETYGYSEDVTVYVNGSKIDNGQYKPIIVNDRAMVRPDPVFDALGFTHTDLDQYNSVTFIKNGTNEAYRFVAEKNYAISGTGYDEEAVMSEQDTTPYIYFDVPATLQFYDVFYVPIRAFCEMAGLDISWDVDTRTVSIVSDSGNSEDDSATGNATASNDMAGSYRAYASGDGVANLDITAVDSSSIMITYTHRHDHSYDIGNVTAYLKDDGTFDAQGENRDYILRQINSDNILFTLKVGNDTVEELTFTRL